MKRTVTVLQDDIDHGVRENAWKCAVARAMNRDLADLADLIGSSYANVTLAYLYLGRDQVLTPPVVAKFIARFDNGCPVEPFKFEVEFEVGE